MSLRIHAALFFAALIAVALGKDVFTRDKAWQAALIFLGVWLVGRRPRPAPVPAE